MKKLKTTIFGILLFMTNPTFATSPISDTSLIRIELSCQITDRTIENYEHPRTPVHTPNIYMDISTRALHFENPCYSMTLELINSETNITVFSYSIPDGDSMVLLPTWLEGEYELHIHRGNYCFFGIIEL